MTFQDLFLTDFLSTAGGKIGIKTNKKIYLVFTRFSLSHSRGGRGGHGKNGPNSFCQKIDGIVIKSMVKSI